MSQLPAISVPLAADAGHVPGHVLIIGGGASGVLMAAHLLSGGDRLRVTIVETANLLGCGLAYSTRDPDHLLNTRVHNMSAFPDDPHHFLHWLQTRPEGRGITDQCFVSRATYGAYLSDLLTPWTQGPQARRLTCLRETCETLRETETGILAQLGNGQTVAADLGILATGHVLPRQDPRGLLSGAWEGTQGIDPDGRVVIIGSGLSMVDQVLSLVKSGHRGPILTISRRGQMPRSHAPTRPLAVAVSEVPFGARMSVIFRWARDLAARAEAGGGTWRDAVDGMRPHVTAIWQSLPQAERLRFLRHVVSWWDVHRHRIPSASEERIAQAVAAGQLVHQRAAFLRAEATADGGLRAVVRPHGHHDEVGVQAVRIIDCRGIRNDPEHNATPLFADLLAQGKAQVDPLRIGLQVAGDCRVIDAAGRASPRLLAIGPVSRAAFWEITAIPDIRGQVASLAGRIRAALPAG